MNKNIKILLDNFDKNTEAIKNLFNKYTDKIFYKSKNKYNTMCTCLDFLEDTILAIEYFIEKHEDLKKANKGECYLKLFGLIDCLNRQLDTILEIYDVLNLKNTYLTLEKELSDNNKFYNSKAFSVFLYRHSFSEKELQLEICDKNSGKNTPENLNIEDIIIKHLESVNVYLVQIRSKLEVDYEK